MQTSNLRWFHWLVLITSLALTMSAWYYTKSANDRKMVDAFKLQKSQVIEMIEERMKNYEDALWAGAGLLYSQNHKVSHMNWLSYTNTIQIEKKYPGINGIGIIKAVPENKINSFLGKLREERPDFNMFPMHQHHIKLPIIYVNPEKINKKAIGLDVAHEDNRRNAAFASRDTGQAKITGPIVLVQDENKTAGFLFYVPVYTNGVQSTVESRRNHFYGLVYAPFIVEKLMQGTLDAKKRYVNITISDSGQKIFDEVHGGNSHFDSQPLFTAVETIYMYGRHWKLTFVTNTLFRHTYQSNQPFTILFSGIGIDIILLILFLTLSNANKKAEDYAKRLYHELILKTESLEESNAHLEEYARVASHDLRAPLRGIKTIVGWIEEDHRHEISPEVFELIQKINKRANRLDNLISDILHYSKINSESSKQKLDLNSIIDELFSEVNTAGRCKISLEKKFPEIVGCEQQVSQIFQNLIVNAINHNDKSLPEVMLDYKDESDHYIFSVADNGPGINPQFHRKIFNMFQTLSNKPAQNSSGLGLAIAQRIIDINQERIWVESKPGEGATFHFTWSKHDAEQAESHDR